MRAAFGTGILCAVPGRDIVIIGATLDLGAGRRGVDMGPSAIRYAGLEARLDVARLRLRGPRQRRCRRAESTDRDDPQRALPARDQGARASASRRASPRRRRGCIPLVLGGDHSVALGTIGGLARRATAPARVLWIDAHGDLNTPDHLAERERPRDAGRRALGHGGERFVSTAWPLPAPSPSTSRTSACASSTRARRT